MGERRERGGRDTDSEDGAAGGDEAVNERHAFLKVVSEDNEAAGVDERAADSKQDAISQIQPLQLL